MGGSPEHIQERSRPGPFLILLPLPEGSRTVPSHRREVACRDLTAPALLATELCQSLTCASDYLLASGSLAGQEGTPTTPRVESASLSPWSWDPGCLTLLLGLRARLQGDPEGESWLRTVPGCGIHNCWGAISTLRAACAKDPARVLVCGVPAFPTDWVLVHPLCR